MCPVQLLPRKLDGDSVPYGAFTLSMSVPPWRRDGTDDGQTETASLYLR